MAIVRDPNFVPFARLNDPDDHRIDSEMAFVFDPSETDGNRVEGLTCIFERIGVGERIPLHSHPTTDEIIIVDEGLGEVTLGEESSTVEKGAVIFIPAGTVHGMRNAGCTDFRMHGVFPNPHVSVQMIERNPAPGTEGNEPQPPYTVDLRQGWTSPH